MQEPSVYRVYIEPKTETHIKNHKTAMVKWQISRIRYVFRYMTQLSLFCLCVMRLTPLLLPTVQIYALG